jgi:hypothetical protein
MLRSIDDIFASDMPDDAFTQDYEPQPEQQLPDAGEPTNAYSGEDPFSYTAVSEKHLKENLRKPVEKKQDKKPKKKAKKNRAKAILDYLRRDIIALPQGYKQVVEPIAIMDSYFASKHYRQLEDHLQGLKREAFPIAGKARTPLHRGRYNGSSPVAAMAPTKDGAHILIDSHYERHLAQMARNYRVPATLTLEQRAEALRDYTLDHENTHRYQKHMIESGVSEIKLEQDVEKTLMGFYQKQLKQYAGTPEAAKFSYLCRVAQKRYADVGRNYGTAAAKKAA